MSPTRRPTGRRPPSPASTGRTRRSTATSTTVCTPRWTPRSTASDARSPRAAPPTPYWCAPPTTARCWDPTAGCTRSGSTCTTRRPACRSSSPGWGRVPPSAGEVAAIPTSHVDLVPTLLSAAGLDAGVLADSLRERFTEVHPLPGHDLMPLVADPTAGDAARAVYLMTRDNMLEGDSGLSGLARRLGRTSNPPPPLRIQVAAHVGSNFEGVVVRVDEGQGGDGHLWKLVRSYDDPATWTEPGTRHLAANGLAGPEYRTAPLPDQWELYDLDSDPAEAINRWDDPSAAVVLAHLQTRLAEEQRRCIPARHQPWPYAARRSGGTTVRATPPPPARVLRRLVQRLGMHPDDHGHEQLEAPGRRRARGGHQPRPALRRQAHRGLCLRAHGAVLLLPGRRDVRRRGQPARRTASRSIRCRSSPSCAARPTIATSPTTCSTHWSATRLPSPTSTSTTTT